MISIVGTCAWARQIFRAAPSHAVSVIVSVSSLGGVVLPPIPGLLLERVSPVAGVALVAAACVGMLLLLLAVKRGARGEAVAEPAMRAQVRPTRGRLWPSPAARSSPGTSSTGTLLHDPWRPRTLYS